MEHFPHRADVGARGLATTREDAFEPAALALIAVITDLGIVAPKEMVQLSCMVPDVELLRVDWRSILIFEMVTRRMLFSRFEVHLEDNHHAAKGLAEALDVSRHHPSGEVNGATYTALKIAQQPNCG